MNPVNPSVGLLGQRSHNSQAGRTKPVPASTTYAVLFTTIPIEGPARSAKQTISSYAANCFALEGDPIGARNRKSTNASAQHLHCLLSIKTPCLFFDKSPFGFAIETADSSGQQFSAVTDARLGAIIGLPVAGPRGRTAVDRRSPSHNLAMTLVICAVSVGEVLPIWSKNFSKPPG